MKSSPSTRRRIAAVPVADAMTEAVNQQAQALQAIGLEGLEIAPQRWARQAHRALREPLSAAGHHAVSAIRARPVQSVLIAVALGALGAAALAGLARSRQRKAR